LKEQVSFMYRQSDNTGCGSWQQITV